MGVPTLALHFGALGDFVLSWPALGLLAHAAGPAGLVLVGQPAWGRLVLPAARVRDRESASLAGLFSPEPDPGLDPWLAGFARAVVFARRPDPVLLAHLTRAGVERVWAVPTQPGPGDTTHASRVQVQALAELGLANDAPPLAPRLVRPVPPGPAVLAPGSGGRAKRLEPELAHHLARRLVERHGAARVVLGPAEEPAYRQAIAAGLAGGGVEFVADPQIGELAEMLAAAPLYIGPDSGVSHLAAALGAPCLVGFGPSDPRIWAPLGPRVRVVGMAELAALAGSGPGATAGAGTGRGRPA